MILPDALLRLLRAPSSCHIATLMPDGSPQLTQVWVDTDGEHVVINSVDTHRKVRNIRRDPRVAVNVTDPESPAHFFQIRGTAVLSYEGAAEHIEALSLKYTGRPYPWYGGRDQVRVRLTIDATSVSEFGR
ncbi:PPOX class F420-dependent oxidoreductase [Planctomonas sp. JC2975]|uniref:TIGR03618 family F420-dependent PPOX class oxidoreductase n=1 Tax=Planctomonas sp. JC2975 TaxID=2729626 RepID=UPI001473A4DF|nr:PPOX class F420-dependent oxidoreductase [Planctomonas sp. JC2975]